MNCSACHTPLPDDAQFCTQCGAARYLPSLPPRHAATGVTQKLPSPRQVAAPGRLAAPFCWQCHRVMEQGFVPDFDDRTGADPQIWVRGWPDRNPRSGQIQIKGQDIMPIKAYRCPDCGLVLFYARPAKP